MENYSKNLNSWKHMIGKKVVKQHPSDQTSSNKRFKSGNYVNTISGIIVHPILEIPAFTFKEDDSYVECRRCKLAKQITGQPGDLDTIREKFENYSHFTVRKGKAKYHMLYLATHSCGIYYAVRAGDYGLEGKRQLEPTDEIICWGT